MKFRKKKVKLPKEIQGTGFYVPMDIAPNEYGGVDWKAIKKVLTEAIERDWGPRCLTKDYEDFPELHDDLVVVGDPDAGRCPCCLAWEKFDKFWAYIYPDDDTPSPS